jgi:hypothetical protein
MPITTHETSPAGKQVKSCLMQIDCVVIKPELIHRQNKTRSGSDNRSDNTNINNKIYTVMETNLKVELFENEVVIVRNDGSAVIVTEDNNISLAAKHVTAIVNNIPVMQEYHRNIANRDSRIASLERDVAGMVEDRNKLNRTIAELNAKVDQKPIIRGYAANYHGSELVDIDDKFICDCGTTWRAAHVAECDEDGQVDIDTVKLLFIGKGKKAVVDSNGDGQGV